MNLWPKSTRLCGWALILVKVCSHMYLYRCCRSAKELLIEAPYQPRQAIAKPITRFHEEIGASDALLFCDNPRGVRGSARLRLGGEEREAIHDLDQSLAMDPAQPLAFLQKGQALLKLQV